MLFKLYLQSGKHLPTRKPTVKTTSPGHAGGRTNSEAPRDAPRHPSFMKIAVITPIPTPYRDPFWNEFARQPGIDLHVFYCSAGKGDRPWNVDWSHEFKAEVLPGRNLLAWRGCDASCYWNPGIRHRLRTGNFDAILIGGYNHLTMWAAIQYAKRHNVPYFLMCETFERSKPRGWRKWIKRPIVRYVVKHARGGLPTGSFATEYLVSHGARPENLVRLPNVPDVVALARQAEELRPLREQIRRSLGIGTGPVALFVGRLIPKKRASLLIRAFKQAAPEGDAQLVIVGSGPKRLALKQLAVDLGIENRVIFAGFVQPADVPKYYVAADVFVLPSSETWGVVVSEALASGVPVIVSDEVGCHPDVVNSRTVGEVVRAGDESNLSESMIKHLSSPMSPSIVEEGWRPVFEAQRYGRLADRLVTLLPH